MFSNGHVTVMSCLFLQYDPSANPKNSVRLVWKVAKALMYSSECKVLLGYLADTPITIKADAFLWYIFVSHKELPLDQLMTKPYTYSILV